MANELSMFISHRSNYKTYKLFSWQTTSITSLHPATFVFLEVLLPLLSPRQLKWRKTFPSRYSTLLSMLISVARLQSLFRNNFLYSKVPFYFCSFLVIFVKITQESSMLPVLTLSDAERLRGDDTVTKGVRRCLKQRSEQSFAIKNFEKENKFFIKKLKLENRFCLASLPVCWAVFLNWKQVETVASEQKLIHRFPIARSRLQGGVSRTSEQSKFAKSFKFISKVWSK